MIAHLLHRLNREMRPRLIRRRVDRTARSHRHPEIKAKIKTDSRKCHRAVMDVSTHQAPKAVIADQAALRAIKAGVIRWDRTAEA